MNTNPVSGPNTDPTWGSALKAALFKRPKNDSLFEIYKGAILGSFTAVLITPGLYGINMAMLKQNFVFRDCMRGVLLNGVNVVPQTAVQVAAFAFLSKVLFPHKKMTLAEEALAASLAGGASGIVTATGELAVLNYQAQKEAVYKISQIVRMSYQAGGLTRCFGGTGALSVREMIWAPTYLTLSPKFSDLLQPYINNEHARNVIGAIVAGGIGGVLTNPPNFLRAQKQKDAHMEMPVRSYWQIIEQEGAISLFRGAKQRAFVVAVACLIVTEAKKVLAWGFASDGRS